MVVFDDTMDSTDVAELERDLIGIVFKPVNISLVAFPLKEVLKKLSSGRYTHLCIISIEDYFVVLPKKETTRTDIINI